MNPNYFVITEHVAHVFHRLSAASDIIHANRGLTAGMRSLLMGLAATGPRTVARMADDRPVSRQYVQRLVDDMVEMGLVQTRPNPEHKRSVLIEITRKGRAAAAAIAKVEAPLVETLFEGFSEKELAVTAHVLVTLTEKLSSETLKQLSPARKNDLKASLGKSKQESEK
jgi:DNA-binding MarR family transcriptional regulator